MIASRPLPSLVPRPSFTSERVQTLFFDKAAGRARKIWCLGTRLAFTCFTLALRFIAYSIVAHY